MAATVWEEYLDLHKGIIAQNAAPPVGYAALTVTDAQRDSMGNTEMVFGTINGEGPFPVPMMGKAQANVNDIIRVSFDRSNVAGVEFNYDKHLFTSFGGAGLVASEDTYLPAPEWGSPALTATLGGDPGQGIYVNVKAFLTGVEAKYRPSQYMISYRVVGEPNWVDQILPGIGTSVQLARAFAPGVTIEAKPRAIYAWASRPGEEGEVRVFLLPSDTNSPGTVSTADISTATPGALVVTPTGSIDATYGRAYQYEVATSAGGAGLQTFALSGPLTFKGTAGVGYYVAVRVIGKNNTLGTRWPSVSGFSGPHVVQGAYVADTTPPNAFTLAPTVTAVTRQDGNGQVFVALSVTLPSGQFPADHDHTELQILDTVNSLPSYRDVQGTTLTTEQPVDYGSYQVSARMVDKTGNKQPTFGPSTSTITITRPGLPATAASPTVDQFAMSLRVRFTMPTGAEYVEIQRSTTSGGAVDPLWPSTNPLVRGTFYLDNIATNVSAITLPTYWYRVRGVNTVGQGVWSAWVSGTLLRLDGSHILADTITVGQISVTDAAWMTKIFANQVMATTFLTAAAPNTRLEMRGAVGVNPNQIRMIENNGGTERLRAILNGSGFYLYGDAAQGDISMYRDSGGRGHFTALNFDIQQNLMTIGVSNTAVMRFTGGAAGDFDIRMVAYNGIDNVGIYAQNNATDTAFGFRQGSKWIWLNGGNNSSRPRIEFSTNSIPNVWIEHNASNQFLIRALTDIALVGGTLTIDRSGGTGVSFGANGSTARVLILSVPQTSGSWGFYSYFEAAKVSNAATDWQGIVARWVVQRALGTTGSTYQEMGDFSGGSIWRFHDGSSFKFQVNGGRLQALDATKLTAYNSGNSQYTELYHDGNTNHNNTQGSMYYGWNSNPGGFHYFSRGGGAGGTVWCDQIQRNTEAVPSDPRLKTDIADLDLGGRAGKRLRGIKIQTFKYKAEGKGARRRIGVMANEVAAVLGQDAVIEMTPPVDVPRDEDGYPRALRPGEKSPTRPHPDWINEDGSPMLAIDKGRLDMLVLKGVQEADERLDEAEATITLLLGVIQSIPGVKLPKKLATLLAK